uniref:Large polyvalent protein associated domain-containing protein n=1 Tax=viral metagenome TaxID=1070528 RepID=A0A6M3XJY2_9ZZZZ
MPNNWIPRARTIQEDIAEELGKIEALRTTEAGLLEQWKHPLEETQIRWQATEQFRHPIEELAPPVMEREPAWIPEPIAEVPAFLPSPVFPEADYKPPGPPIKYAKFSQPLEYAPTPWYRTFIEKATAPFRWLHEKVEVPGAAIVWSPVTPEILRKPGESWWEWEKRQYKAWKAPKFVKGVTEFAITIPVFLIPYGGISVASSKALANVVTKAGMVNTATVVRGFGEIIPTVEKLMALPFKAVGVGARHIVARKVPLEVIPTEQISHQIGDIVLPSVAAMEKKSFDKAYVWTIKDRFKPLEWVINKIDPSILAATPEARLTIAYNRVLDAADAATTFQMAPLINLTTKGMGAIRYVKELFGLDDLQIATKVTAKVAGSALDMPSIVAFPGKYILTAEQSAWIKKYLEVWQPIRDELKRVGILERELAFEEGEGGWLGRLVTGFEDPVTKKFTEIRSGSLFTMGAKPGVKPRVIKDPMEARRLGFRYADPLTTSVYRIRQSLYALANMDYVKSMMAIPGVRPIGAKALPERIARDTAMTNARDTKFVLDRLRRLSRGEKLTRQSIKAIEQRNPDVGKMLRTAAENKELRPQELGGIIKGLNRQYESERLLALKAREQASEKLAKTRRPALMTEGIVYPIPGLRNQIMPQRVANYINKELGTTQNRWINSMASAQGVVRMLQTGIDLGPYFLQGMPTMMTNPVVWEKTVKSSMEILFRDDATLARIISQPVHRETLAKIIPHGFTLNGAEFVEAAPLLGKLPFIGGTFTRWARWFNGALDLGRLYQIEAMMMNPSIRQAGDAGLRALVDHMGKRWGVMSTRWLGIPAGQRQIENALLFYASRWTRSGFAIMKDALTRGGIEGVLARDMVGRMMLGMTMMYYGFSKALGQEPNLDPSSGKFMTVQLGTDHVGFGGMYIALARFGGNVLRTLSENPAGFVTLDSRDNPFVRFARGRVAPLTGTSIDIITGKTFLGEPIDSFPSFGKYVAIRNLTPFWLSGWLEGLVGAQPMPSGGAAAEFFGMRTWPLQPWERREDLREQYAQMEYGKTWAELRVLDRRKLEVKHPDLKEITEEAWRQSIKKGRPSQVAYGQWRNERDAVNSKYEEGLWELQARVDKGELTGYDFRLGAQKLGAARSFALDRIDERPEYKDVIGALDQPRIEPKITPQFADIAYEFYTKLMFSGDLEIGIAEYDFAEADKRRQWFIATFGEPIYKYVRERLTLGRDIPPLMREYYKAQEVMHPYWQVRDWAERTYGKPKTAWAETLLSRIIQRLRQHLRRSTPEVEKYYQMFYTR